MSFKYGIPTVSRRDFLKGGALGMAIVSGAALAGCDNGGGEQTPAGGDSGSKGVGIAVATAPITLDPLAALDTISMTFISQGLECLFEKDAEGEIKPAACESYKVSDDQLTWTFTLRDATWSNGDPVVADDFICSWQRNAQADSGVADFQYQIEMAAIKNYAAVLDGSADVSELGISAPDDKTIVIELEHPVPFMLDLLSFTPWAPVNRAFREEKGDMFGITKDDQIYNGPFTVTQYDSAANTFVLTKNEGYWDVDNVALDTVTFQVIPETQQAVMAYESGTVDYVELTGDLVAQYQDNEAFGTWDGQFNYYLMMNTTREGMNNENFRRAIACAINREEIIQGVLDGYGQAQTTVVNRGVWSFYDDMEGFDYDVDRAKQLLSEAGYSEDELTVTLYISNGSPYTSIAPMIQNYLGAIGVNVDIQQFDEATLKSECQSGNQQMFLWRWNVIDRLDEIYTELFSTDYPTNYHHYSDSYVDEMAVKVLTEKDKDTRLQLSQDLQTYLVEACPQVPLYVADLVIAYREGLTGQYLFGGGNHNWSWAYVQN